MSRRKVSRKVERELSELAETAFADHQLVWREDLHAWRCGQPDSGIYAFCVFTAPGMTCIWGDLGEAVIRHADSDAIGWLLSQGRKDAVYPDYFASKVEAVSRNDSTAVLWIWHAIHAFARLYDALPKVATDREVQP